MDDLSLLGPDFYQDINLDGSGSAQTVHTFNIDIHASPASAIGAEDAGSNKVKITTITNQNWEILEHRGKIVASNIHYLVYALKGSKGCVLRLIRRDNSFRALFKGFVGSVMDVAFCHSRSNLLACIDEGGNLYIWDLDKANSEATAQADAMKITVQHESAPVAGEHRLVWSPHIQSEEDEEEDQDICYLVVTRASRVGVLDIHYIFNKYSSGSIVPKDKLSCNHFVVPDAHEGDILDLSLSPDGAVLATAGVDGHLKFWQVNMEVQIQEEPKCLHDFKPHKGAPVSRLIFCDNHLCQDPSNQFWRFLITASPDNNEVKIWCTVNWKCLQMIRFYPPRDESDPVSPSMLLNMDLSASYLIVADSRRKAFLVLQLMTDLALGDASVTSVTEYLLTQPILSFVVCGCAAIPERVDRDEYSDEGDSAEEEGEGEESTVTMRSGLFDTRRNIAMIKLHCVHTRSMQELLVRFEPPDLFGVPPSKEHSKLNLPTQQRDSSSSEVLGAPYNSSLQPTSVSVQSEPSLPTDVHKSAMPTTLEMVTPPKSALTHSPMAHSLKLLTPSDITSGKHETTPLLSPADIRASVSSSSGADLNMAQDWPVFNPLDNSVTDTVTSLSLDTASNTATAETNTLLSVSQSPTRQATEGLIGAVTPPSIPDSEDEVKSKPSNNVSGTGRESGDEIVSSSNDQILTVDSLLQNTAKEEEEEEEPSEEEAKQAFKDILQMLQVKEQNLPGTHEMPAQTFQEFTELIQNPDKIEVEKRRIEDSVKAYDENTQEIEKSACLDNKNEDKKEEERIGEVVEDVLVTGAIGTSVDKQEYEFKDPSSMLATETHAEGASMETTSRGGVESSVDLEGSPVATCPKTPQDSPTTPLQDVTEDANNSEGQEAPVAVGVPEAKGVLGGDESNETCGAHKGSEEKMTMPCALSDNVFSVNQAAPEPPIVSTELTVPEAAPTEAMSVENAQIESRLTETPTDYETIKAPLTDDKTTEAPPTEITTIEAPPTEITSNEAPPTEIKTTEAPPTEITSSEAPPTEITITETFPTAIKTFEAPPTDIQSKIDPPILVEPTEASAAVVQTQETTKAGQKSKKARKRSKKTKKEANIVDTAEIEDRLSDMEVSGSDSQLVLVEPPQDMRAQFTHTEPAVRVVTATGLSTSQQDVISQLSQVMAAQKELLEKMESEQHTTRVAMQVEVQRLREGLLEEQKTILAEFRREQQSRLDRIMKEKQSLDKAKQDKLISSISQTLTTAVQAKLDKLVKMEMRNTVVPAVNESVASVRGELSKNVSHCISQTNEAIRSRLAELTKSKEMSDAIGKAVSVHLQGALPAVLETIFKAVVLEPVERAFQGMFKQIDETFRKGTIEYLLQLQQQEQQLQSSLFHHVDSSLQSLHTSLTSTQNTAPVASHIQDTIHQELAAFSQTVQDGVLKAVSRVIHEEVAVIADSSHKISDTKDKISQLLKSQQYNEAFELCLSTADLPLVIFTCQQVDPDVLFDCSPIPLSQAVLLSLIQQLSVDLLDNLEMKLKFLDPSVLALDTHDEVTKSHMVVVIKQLSEKLRTVQDKASASSISPIILKQVKRLFQVTQHLCR